MRVLDLFSGIGGFSLALERVGFKTAMFCEIDPFCQSILRKHWPHVPIHDDIKSFKIVPKVASKIDLICGGFPCQDISLAGKKIGIGGNRSGLWKEFKKIIKKVRPSYAIIENVAALRTNGLITVLQDLRSIGYDAEWEIISAAQIGAPHLRDRIWIVAYPCRYGRSKKSRGAFKNEKKDGTKRHIFTDRFIKKLQLATPHTTYRGTMQMCKEKIISNENGGSSKKNAANSSGKGFNGLLWKGKEVSNRTRHSKKSYWEKIKPPFCGMDDGLSSWPYKAHNQRGLKATLERERKERVKAMGNSIVPQIVELIGQQIIDLETKK